MLTIRPAATAAALVLCLALSGCAAATDSASGAEAASPVAGETLLPLPSGPDDLVLFNRYLQRFAMYDEAARAIQESSNVPNYLQYEFRTPSDLYTAGNGFTLGFSIVQVVDETIRTVVEVGPDQGVFPVATDGTRSFFILVNYDTNGTEVARTLVRLEDDGRLITYDNAVGLIDTGAILGDSLYYTTFEVDTQRYSLHRLDAATPDAAPAFVAGGLMSGRVYVHDGALYTADLTSIFRDDDRFECADLCYFFDDQGILVRIRVDQNSDLTLDVVDTRTKAVIGTSTDVIDFRVFDGQVTVYAPDRIDTIEVPA